MKIKNTILIGAGGIGGAVFEPLVRLLKYHENGSLDFTLIEQDEFSESNLHRQICRLEDIGKNKGEVLIDIYSEHQVMLIPEYINRNNISDCLYDISVEKGFYTLIVLAVDNDATRKLILEYLLAENAYEYIFVNATNGYTVFQTSVHIPGKTVSPLLKYENINNPSDYIPGGCAEEAPSTPQLLVANRGAALTVLLIVNNLLNNDSICDEYIGDILSGKMKGVGKPFKLT